MKWHYVSINQPGFFRSGNGNDIKSKTMTQILKPGAIILAGGQSRRMGRDKALIRLTPQGPRLLEMVLAAIQPLASSIVISTNRPSEYSWAGLPLVEDNYPACGPLAGLEAGLSASPAELNLVVACDMPWLAPPLLEYMLQLAPAYAAVVPLNRTGRLEPLCAVYSKNCLPVIRRHLKIGSLKMTGWLDEINTLFVPAAQLAKFDSELRSFRNINCPEDLSLLYNESNRL
jgi:molybdenum cofactor guanylyltransferase